MTTTGTTTPTRPPRRLKRPLRCDALNAILFLGAGVLAVAAILAAVTIAYIAQTAYQAGHQATPTAAVQDFLDAALNDRHMATVEKYLCNNQTVHRSVGTLITGINTYTRHHPNTTLTYDWDNVHQTTRTSQTATVTADIRTRATVSGTPLQEPAQLWSFQLADHAGWKICRLTRH